MPIDCYGCAGVCSDGCDNSCDGTCNGCTNSCSSCTGGCDGCSGGCDGGCSGSCDGSCKNGCKSCSATCDDGCLSTCLDGCQGCNGCTGCSTTCQGYCSGTCSAAGGGYVFGPPGLSEVFNASSKLKRPSISYPSGLGDSGWSTNIRILFTLPEDPDYYQLNMKDYTYHNISVKIDSTEYTFLNNPEMFSVKTLTYRRQVVFSLKSAPELSVNNYHTATIRVEKNYGSGDDWSDWSNPVEFYIISKTDSISVSQYSKITFNEYQKIYSRLRRMKRAYNNTQMTTPNRQAGNIIYRSDFSDMMADLNTIITLINTWGSFDNANIRIATLPAFSPKQEIITASGTGNYFITAIGWLNTLLQS